MTNGEISTAIRQEAHNLLHNHGLLALLEGFGTPRPHGSYALDLMAWRDLDIYLVTDNQSLADFFSLGANIASLLQPARMHFRNELLTRSALPNGLYWGVYLPGDPGWKIDIWQVPQAEFERLIRYETQIEPRLTPEARRTIVYLKGCFWQHPLYRQAFSARDIYDAVLFEEIEDPDSFVNYLVEKGIHI